MPYPMPVRSALGILTSIPITYSYALSDACEVSFRDLDLYSYSLFLCLFLCISMPISNACRVAFQILTSIPTVGGSDRIRFIFFMTASQK